MSAHGADAKPVVGAARASVPAVVGAFVYAVCVVGTSIASVTAGQARLGVALLCVAAAAHYGLVTGVAVPGARARRAVVVAAAVAGAIWLAHAPPFSDDVYRYLLDGRLGAAGVNPYAYAPESPKVAELVSALPGAVNHPELPTIYPPVAQALFALAGLLGGGLIAWRLVCLLLVGVGVWAVSRAAPTVFGRSTAWALPTHPLVVLTAAGNGNVDIAALGLLGVALFGVARRVSGDAGEAAAGGTALAGVGLGLAAGVKLFPIGFAAAWLGRSGLTGAVRVGVVALAVLAACYLPVAGVGAKATGSLGRYAEAWEFNATGYRALDAGAEWALRSAGMGESAPDPFSGGAWYGGQRSERQWRSRGEFAGRIARALGAAVLVGVVLALWRRRRGPAESLAWLMMALLAVSPVVHPWYLLWLLVPAWASGNRAALAWCAAVCGAFWAPAVAADVGEWSDPAWVAGAQVAAIGVALASRRVRKVAASEPCSP